MDRKWLSLISMLFFACVFVCAEVIGAYGQTSNLKSNKNLNSQPSSPKTKKDKDRVYLVHSDELRYDKWRNNDAQVLTGNVHFEHDGANLYCDSANFFEQSNSFEAWGSVRMLQGDTLSLAGDYAYYDGNNKTIVARVLGEDYLAAHPTSASAGKHVAATISLPPDGGKRRAVVLRNRNTTLYTDELFFDRIESKGFYETGGRLEDNTTTLTSNRGEYHTDSKDARFTDEVVMVDKKFTLTTDTLDFNTASHRAHIIGPSDIVSGRSHIYSEQGYYNTDSEVAELLERSVLNNGGRTITGDSLWHDGHSGISEAFVNVIYKDSVNSNMLFCDYGFYNDSTGYALCTEKAMAVDFSQRDSLFIHADTFKVFTYNIDTDSVYRIMHGYNHVRAWRIDVQAVCDSMVYHSQDSCLYLYNDPILWNVNQQLLGEEIRVYMKDSVIDHAHVITDALSIEELNEPEVFNQVSSKEMFAYFTDGDIHEAQAVDNVLVAYYPEESSDSSYVGLVSMETTKLRMFMEKKKLQRIWTPKSNGVVYPMSQIPPAKRYLEAFQWYDYVRPTSKQDIFVWRGKRKNNEQEH